MTGRLGQAEAKAKGDKVGKILKQVGPRTRARTHARTRPHAHARTRILARTHARTWM